PLATPGGADLTAHVDFEAVARAAAPARASAMTAQGVFLERLGIATRAEALAKRLDGPALASHLAAHRRLTHPAEMGDLFKVMALVAPGAPLPPGVDAMERRE
ncbi:MAG: class I SAM-dependent methyltransferase, partial [Jannaschia sp.]